MFFFEQPIKVNHKVSNQLIRHFINFKIIIYLFNKFLDKPN